MIFWFIIVFWHQRDGVARNLYYRQYRFRLQIYEKKRKPPWSILIKAKENKSYFCTKQTTKSQICQEQLLMLHTTKSMLQNRESAASQLPFPTTPLNLTRGRGLWQHKPRHRQGHDDDASGRSHKQQQRSEAGGWAASSPAGGARLPAYRRKGSQDNPSGRP